MRCRSLLILLAPVFLCGCPRPTETNEASPPCNDGPAANAGPDQQVAIGDTVQMSAGGSVDFEGSTDGLTYEWQQTDGAEVGLSTIDTRDFEFVPAVSDNYVFFLIVTDRNGCTDRATVNITASEVESVVSQSGGNWSDDIWDLEGGFPNNDGEQSFSVTIDEGQSIALDTDVELTALSLAPTSQLAVANEVEGDLTIVGQLDSEGALVAGGGRSIHVDGPLAILPGGSYGGPDTQGDPTNAALEAGSITIYEGPIAGSMEVSGNMQVTTADDFVLEGVIRMPLCTPPVFRTRDLARVRVSKDFKINKAATIEYQASERMLLGGSFLNDSIDPTTFDWASGGLSFFAPNGSSTHSFEVAGRDQGASVGFSGNFTMGEVEVGSGCNVTFEDKNDNDEQGQEPCSEALYVHTLIIQPESALTLDNVRVYCDTVEGDREQVVTAGCGELVVGCEPDLRCSDEPTDTICSSETVMGSIDSVVEQDTYTFTGQAGDRVFIQANRKSGTIDPHINLFKPNDGAREAQVSDNLVALLFAHPLAESGQYTILIRDSGGDETGEYIMSLLVLPDGPLTRCPDQNGGPIVFDEPVLGNIDSVVDMDAYTFTGQAGQRVTIQANRMAGTVDPHINLFRPSDGAREAQVADTTVALLFAHPLAESGQYTVLIRDSGGNETGEYILSVSPLP